ncbi:MAG: transposase [Dehalococcoidia bacterium]
MPGVPFPKRIRLTPAVYADRECTFHLVLRARTGTAPFRDPATATLLWSIVEQQNARGRVTLLAACLMPDHLHLLAKPDEDDLVRWCNSFKSFTAHACHGLGQQGSLWQPSFYDRAIQGAHEFEETLKYIWDNPAAAGLLESGGTWPWRATWLDPDGAASTGN